MYKPTIHSVQEKYEIFATEFYDCVRAKQLSPKQIKFLESAVEELQNRMDEVRYHVGIPVTIVEN